MSKSARKFGEVKAFGETKRGEEEIKAESRKRNLWLGNAFPKTIITLRAYFLDSPERYMGRLFYH